MDERTVPTSEDLSSNLKRCTNCGCQTTNPKFCSRSCSAVYTNVHFPKKQASVKKTCLFKDCSESWLIRDNPNRYCSKHSREERNKNQTIGDYKTELRAAGLHPSWGNSVLRQKCRAANAFRPQVCQVCGYKRHVEHCHIKPVSSFPPEALLSDINAPSNVYILCRNHHWEFDHGKLEEKIDA